MVQRKQFQWMVVAFLFASVFVSQGDAALTAREQQRLQAVMNDPQTNWNSLVALWYYNGSKSDTEKVRLQLKGILQNIYAKKAPHHEIAAEMLQDAQLPLFPPTLANQKSAVMSVLGGMGQVGVGGGIASSSRPKSTHPAQQ